MPICAETTQLPKACALQRNEQDVRMLALACGDRDCSSLDSSVVRSITAWTPSRLVPRMGTLIQLPTLLSAYWRLCNQFILVRSRLFLPQVGWSRSKPEQTGRLCQQTPARRPGIWGWMMKRSSFGSGSARRSTGSIQTRGRHCRPNGH